MFTPSFVFKFTHSFIDLSSVKIVLILKINILQITFEFVLYQICARKDLTSPLAVIKKELILFTNENDKIKNVQPNNNYHPPQTYWC